MRKKMLLLVSVGAMILSVALLIAPANAFTPHCTSCSALDSNGNTVTATCHVRPVDSCFCPLSGQIISNNCLRIP